MGIFRLIRILGAVLCLTPMLVLGHDYFTHMTAPKEQSARFVSAGGEVKRPAQGQPAFIESAKIMISGLLGKEEQPQSGLAALHTRTNANALTGDELQMREMEFWMNFTSKMGFSGI